MISKGLLNSKKFHFGVFLKPLASNFNSLSGTYETGKDRSTVAWNRKSVGDRKFYINFGFYM